MIANHKKYFTTTCLYDDFSLEIFRIKLNGFDILFSPK